MSDIVLSSSSDLSLSEESNSSPPKKSQKRKWPDSFSKDNEKNEMKKCKIQTENLDRNGHDKKIVKPQFVGEITPLTTNSDGAFQNFIKRCLERRTDGDTKKVLEKLQKLYDKLSSCHKSDDKFKSYVDACYEKITKNLSKDIYTPILELRTEIKNRLQTKLQDEAASDTGVDFQEVSVKKKRQIEQLEESIKKCQFKIKELQEKEVDFDEDQDSAYIQEDKYKKKLVQLCKYLSEITGDTEMKKQIFKKKIRRKDIPGDMTGNSLLDQAVINLINSHIGKINKFKYLETDACPDLIKMPDYVDVLQCIQKSNKNNNLDLSENEMTKLAKRAFKDLGNFLKNKRIHDSEWYIQSLLPDESEDPAEKDIELRKKLQNNKTEGDRRLQAIFKKYLDKQDGVDEEDIKEQTANEESSDDENKCETVHLNSNGRNENSKDEKDKSNSKEKEIFENNTIDKTSFIHVHRMLKSKEKLKDNSDTDTAIKYKETLKDNTVAKSTSKFREAVDKNIATIASLISKEATKADAKTTSRSHETVKKNTDAKPVLTLKEATKGDTKATSRYQEAVKKNTTTESAPKSKETVKGDAKDTSRSHETAKQNTATKSVLTLKEAVKGDTKATSRSHETVKKNTDAKPVLTSKEATKGDTKTTSRSHETVKKNTDAKPVLTSKEAVKGDTKATSRSQEAVKKNTTTESAPKSKETVKGDAKNTSRSHETAKQNTATKLALKSKEHVKDNSVMETAWKSKETLKNNIDTEPASKSKESSKHNKVIEIALKSKESLKNNADAEAAVKCKETFKDNIVTKATSKSQEDVKRNTTTKPALSSKKAVKDNTLLKSKETLKNNTECSNSKNTIFSENRENFEKTAQINNKKEDDDVIIIDISDDDGEEVEKVSERKLPSICTKTESKRIVTVDVESSQSSFPAMISTPKIVPHNISPKKLLDSSKRNDSQIKMSFIKVREFAKSPSSWLTDGIVRSTWLSDG